MQLVLVRELPVDRARRQLGALGDEGDRGAVVAAFDRDGDRGLEDALPRLVALAMPSLGLRGHRPAGSSPDRAAARPRWTDRARCPSGCGGSIVPCRAGRGPSDSVSVTGTLRRAHASWRAAARSRLRRRLVRGDDRLEHVDQRGRRGRRGPTAQESTCSARNRPSVSAMTRRASSVRERAVAGGGGVDERAGEPRGELALDVATDRRGKRAGRGLLVGARAPPCARCAGSPGCRRSCGSYAAAPVRSAAARPSAVGGRRPRAAGRASHSSKLCCTTPASRASLSSKNQ